LEPTFYAALSFHGDPAGDKAWALLSSWQQSDGSWRPSSGVQVDNWGTSLCVTLATVRGEFGEPFQRGVRWLLGSAGVESNLLSRMAARIGLLKAERDISLQGWPWKPDTSSWVEPTVHALVALKKASGKLPSADLQKRVSTGEAQILDVRCRDGGWNYGSRAALGIDLPSYPETTAVALVGLQGRGDLGNSLDVARQMLDQQTASPLARAWLTIALRLHGARPPELDQQPRVPGSASPDLMITAVEALAARDGNYKLLATGGTA
jgi:hypothetical protein